METPIIPGAMTINDGIKALAATYEKPDLSLTSLDDMMTEILSRYEHGVIGLERADKVDAKLGDYKVRWKGNPFMALGLADFIKADVNRYTEKNPDA